MIKNKSDAVVILNDFSTMVKTQYKVLILCFRTNNAKELYEGVILDLFNAKGIRHQKTCTNNPQQSGVVEGSIYIF